MYAVTEVTNEQYKEPTGSRLFEVWESGLAKPPSVAIRSLHNVVNRYLRVTRPEAAEDISNGNVDVIVYLARHDNEEIFPQDIEQRFGVTRSTSCRVLGLMEQKGLIARVPVKRDARLKKIVLTDKSRHIAEVLRDNAKNMERILLEGLDDDQIRQFMHVLDVMQTKVDIQVWKYRNRTQANRKFRKNRRFRKKHAMTMPRIIAMLVMSTSRTYCGYRRKWRSSAIASNTRHR